jgi:DeoR family transcriptional regulator of aga operon
VTPALNIALEAGRRSGVEVLVCGGRLNPKTLSTTAHEIARSVSEIFADRLFLATYGIDIGKGLAERSVEVAETKRALIRAAREITLVCDSSKFSSTGPLLISPLSVVDRLITDEGVPRAALRWLRSERIAIELV